MFGIFLNFLKFYYYILYDIFFFSLLTYYENKIVLYSYLIYTSQV